MPFLEVIPPVLYRALPGAALAGAETFGGVQAENNRNGTEELLQRCFSRIEHRTRNFPGGRQYFSNGAGLSQKEVRHFLIKTFRMSAPHFQVFCGFYRMLRYFPWP